MFFQCFKQFLSEFFPAGKYNCRFSSFSGARLTKTFFKIITLSQVPLKKLPSDQLNVLCIVGDTDNRVIHINLH